MAQAVFLHIPRTAGSSILQAITSALPPDEAYWVGAERDPNEFWHAADHSAFAGYRFVGGHFDFPLGEKIPGEKLYFSAVRDPVERALSLFRYIVSGDDPNHPLRATLASLTVEQALEVDDFRQQIDNLQCRMLTGRPTFEEARRVMASRPFVVKPYEGSQHLADAICRAIGIEPVTVGRHNVAPAAYREGMASAGAIRKIRALTEEDRKLHEFLSPGPGQPIRRMMRWLSAISPSRREGGSRARRRS
jgi:hypothetical protein